MAKPNIDRLVAKHVMGWRVISEGRHEHAKDPAAWDAITSSKGTIFKLDRAITRWQPSTNLDQAVEVLERLRVLGKPVLIQFGRTGYRVRIGRWSDFTEDSLALAICRAALSSFGVGSGGWDEP